MKKLNLLIPLIILSCSKKEEVVTSEHNYDSVTLQKENIEKVEDSTQAGIVKIEAPATTPTTVKPFRVVEGNKIIRTINGDMFPVTISDKFSSSDQEFILKIKNFTGENISGIINPEDPEMNVRFNQIKYSNDEYDGPFTRIISAPISEEGEIWLIVGKSNMASGDNTGKFSISLK